MDLIMFKISLISMDIAVQIIMEVAVVERRILMQEYLMIIRNVNNILKGFQLRIKNNLLDRIKKVIIMIIILINSHLIRKILNNLDNHRVKGNKHIIWNKLIALKSLLNQLIRFNSFHSMTRKIDNQRMNNSNSCKDH